METESDKNKSSSSIKPKIPNIEMFESIDTVPIVRHHLFNQFILQAVGVGSSMEDVQKKFIKMDEFLAAKLYEQANVERRNLQATMFSMYEGLNYHHLAYACLVRKIDDEDYSHVMTESDVLKIYEKLKTIWITNEDILTEVKKKRKDSIKNYLLSSLQALQTT